jgi:tetratricopeptide (TPR) repeat protein
MNRSLRLLVLQAASVVALLASDCQAARGGQGAPPLPDNVGSPPKPDKPAAQAAAKPVTVEEAQTWAKELARAMRVEDVDAFNRLTDWDAIIDKATTLPENSPQLEQVRSGFGRGLKQATVSPKSGFGRAIMTAIEGAGDYRPLRIHRVNDQLCVLFRLVSSNGALNYHDWVLGRSKAGAVVATDCYVFLAGELYSDTLRRSFLPLAHKSAGVSIENLSGPEKDFVAHFNKFVLMSRYTGERNWRLALNTYKELPSSVQESKPAMTMRLLATQATSEAEYLATIDDFRKHYPNDAMIDLISIDGYILRKAFDKAMEGIDRVDKSVGGDPYLKVLRGNVLLREHKLDAARDVVQKALTEDPNLLRAYYAMIDISLAQHDYAETVKWLKKAESLGVTFGNLTAISAFDQFVKSPEYKAWKNLHDRKE